MSPLYTTLSRAPFSPSRLFRAMEQGLWYDPSDLTAEKIAWRRNLALSSGDLSDSYWLKSASLGMSGSDTAPDSLGKWKTLTDSNASAEEYVYKGFSVVADISTHTESVHIKKTSGSVSSYPMLRLLYNGGTNVDCRVCINTTTGVITSILNATANVSDGGDYWRLSITGVNNGTNNSVTLYLLPAANTTGSTAIAPSTTGSVVAWGVQFEKGTLSPYQRITDFNSDFLAAYPYHTLFQDAAGTIPVTALGQPAGLMLDKRLGLVLGPELIVNGAFDDNSAWAAANTGTGTATIAAGVLTLTGTDASNRGRAYQSFSTVVGASYKITFSASGAASSVFCGTAIGGSGVLAVAGSAGFAVFTATTTTTFLTLLTTSAGGVAFFDNISVRELHGNHAYQTSAPSRPTVEARVNMLLHTDNIGGVVWSKLSTTVSGNRVTASATNGNHLLYQAFTYVPGQSIRYRIQVAKKVGFGFFQLCFSNPLRVKCTLDLSTGEYVVSRLGGADAIVTVTDTGTGRFEVTITGSSLTASGASYFNCGPAIALTGTPTNSYEEPIFLGNGEYMDLYEADLRLASDSQYPYQRVNTATDYVDVGAPRYLSFDGVDDFMVTNSIDFTGTDKVTLWAGVRKLSDATQGMICELSANAASNAGAFFLLNSTSFLDRYQWSSRGTSGSNVTPGGYAAPITNILTGIGAISTDTCILRVNASQAASNATDQGTGNYGNYPLYIGRRNGTSLPFNGRLYQLIVRGAASNAGQIIQTEHYINSKTRAY